jgi:subtilisin family serine protease
MPEGQPLPGPVPGQILVLLDQDQPRSLGRELARAYGLVHIRSEVISLLAVRAELMAVRRGRLDEALALLRGDARVRSAQPNQRYLHMGALDPRRVRSAETAESSAPDGERQRDAAIPQYGPRKLALPAAHDLALGRNVLIAIIDSAIDTEHPELTGAVARSFNAAGRTDARLDYHGTAVAGLIRGHGLIEGAAPQSKLLAVRAFRTNDETTYQETTTHVLILAVDWAVRNGAKVLNMSFVGAHDPALQQMLRAVVEKGVVVIAAAGNGGPEAPPAYPAAYPGVIAVTAIDEADRRYEHANRGSYIAVAAPGVDILAPIEHSGYAYVSGTSFAAAYVSGIAALLLERDPNLDPQTVADLLATAAEHLGPDVRDDDFGAGRVDAYKALKLLANAQAAKKSELARP